MYGGGEVQKDLIPLSTLHMMTSSHSLFLPTMLDSNEESSSCKAKGTYGVKYNGEKTDLQLQSQSFITLLFIFHIKHIFVIISESLVSLLLCLVKKCPAVCNVSHFVVLLGAYGATLSTSGKTGNLSTSGFVCLLSFIPLTSCFALQIRNCYCFSRNMKETMSVC